MKTMSEIIEKIGNMVYDDMVSGFEEYVKNYLSEHNIHLNKTGDKGCNKIRERYTSLPSNNLPINSEFFKICLTSKARNC